MGAIIDFVKAIADGFLTVIDFVVSFVGDIVYIVQLTAMYLAQIPSYFSWLPGELLTIIVTIFAIVVIYKVTGREG